MSSIAEYITAPGICLGRANNYDGSKHVRVLLVNVKIWDEQ